MSDEPNKSNAQGLTDTAASEAAEVGKTLIRGVTPADQGWILGFILVVAIIVLSDMYVNIKTLQQNSERGALTQQYFEMVEGNRANQFDRSMEQWADQSRRYQEVIRALTESVARDSERAGQAAVAAIDEAARQKYVDPPVQNDFIGPPQARPTP